MAGNNFCVNCGAPLQEGARFCTNCGAPVQALVDGGATEPTSDASATEPQPDQTQRLAAPGEAAPMQPAGAQPYVPVRPGSPHPQAAFAQAPYARATSAVAGGNNRHRTIVVIAVVVAALVALALVAALAHAWLSGTGTGGNDGQAQQGQQQGDSDGEANGDASRKQEDDKAGAEAEAKKKEEEAEAQEEKAKKESLDQQDSAFHDSLVSYYNVLSDYDARVRDAASNFNASFLSKDMDLRRSLASSCSSLKVELQGKVDSLGKMTAPEGSAWTTQLSQIRQCYQDHLSRVTVMDSAWQVDLRYPDPEPHQSEILGPISAGNLDGSNKNAALDDYEKLYPQITL
ncbi:zinc ribbon domain-containing protein [Olsenella phocaeensis]|uniref:zinc ribbon domain-containing protein n=1 Tax=Olsenella phocaeensis TaxID=1852385 RepID=UPI0009308142|nr:zinc ribbon domain-containing protein [Olsenella phocaeensis]